MGSSKVLGTGRVFLMRLGLAVLMVRWGGDPAVRVAAGVDLLEGEDADVGVDLGGVEPGVAEHRLDVANVRTAFQHVGYSKWVGTPTPLVSRGYIFLVRCRQLILIA